MWSECLFVDKIWKSKCHQTVTAGRLAFPKKMPEEISRGETIKKEACSSDAGVKLKFSLSFWTNQAGSVWLLVTAVYRKRRESLSRATRKKARKRLGFFCLQKRLNHVFIAFDWLFLKTNLLEVNLLNSFDWNPFPACAVTRQFDLPIRPNQPNQF